MATPMSTLPDHTPQRESDLHSLADVLPEVTVTDVTNALTVSQKAALRTEARRAHLQGLRQQIREITQDLRDGMRAARGLAQELRTLWPVGDPDDFEPLPPQPYRGKPPTTDQLFCYLADHAAWESRHGVSPRQLIRRDKALMETAVKMEAITQIRQAVQAARARVPDDWHALRRDLDEIGIAAMNRVIGHGQQAIPALISHLRPTAADRPKTPEEVEANRRAWLRNFADRMWADKAVRFGAYVPPHGSTLDPDEVAREAENPDLSVPIRIDGRWVEANRETVIARAFVLAQAK